MIIVLLFFLLFSILLLFVISSAFLGFIITRVPFVPTSRRDIEFVLQQLNIKPGQVFYDLGSGDGKVVFLVCRLTGAKGVGFELTWWTHLWAKIKGRFKRLQGKVEFRNEDFFKVPWTKADYVYGYLYPPLMKRVEEKFLNETRPGCVAIIRDFPLPNLKPEEVYYRPGNHEIYIYRKPI